jgi:hypothetical protein
LRDFHGYGFLSIAALNDKKIGGTENIFLSLSSNLNALALRCGAMKNNQK